MQFTDVHTPRSALNKMLILLQNDSAPLMASSNQQQLKYSTCSKNCPTKNELAVHNNKTLNIPKKCRTKWKPRCSVVYLTQASRANNYLHIDVGKLYNWAHPRIGNLFSCMWSGGCKAVFTFWYSDFAKEECNMGRDGLHCKHFQAILKLLMLMLSCCLF